MLPRRSMLPQLTVPDMGTYSMCVYEPDLRSDSMCGYNTFDAVVFMRNSIPATDEGFNYIKFDELNYNSVWNIQIVYYWKYAELVSAECCANDEKPCRKDLLNGTVYDVTEQHKEWSLSGHANQLDLCNRSRGRSTTCRLWYIIRHNWYITRIARVWWLLCLNIAFVTREWGWLYIII